MKWNKHIFVTLLVTVGLGMVLGLSTNQFLRVRAEQDPQTPAAYTELTVCESSIHTLRGSPVLRQVSAGAPDRMPQSVSSQSTFVWMGQWLPYFYGLTLLLLVLFGVGLLWGLRGLRRQRADHETQVNRMQYLLDVEKQLSGAHVQPEQFAGALQRVADFLTAQEAFLWLSEEHPAAQRRFWSSQEESESPLALEREMVCSVLCADLQEQGVLLTYDLPALETEYPLLVQTCRRFAWNSLMAVAVRKADGALIGVLGVCNLRTRWKTAEPLECVAASFARAVEHYRENQRLIRMGTQDILTGLQNRNSYHVALDELACGDYYSLGCLYLDVNGLHEINNDLGHQAGDEMLISVANALLENFSTSDVYRIGGDEFLVFFRNPDLPEIDRQIERVRQSLRKQGYEISAGFACQDRDLQILDLVNEAEATMQREKRQYYGIHGDSRSKRVPPQDGDEKKQI